jgi:cytochrome c5
MFRAVVVLLAVSGCTPSPPHATAADAARANVALAELEQGRTIVVGRCGACHKPPMPTDPWQATMTDMSARAKLDANQRRLAEQYLSVMSVTK